MNSNSEEERQQGTNGMSTLSKINGLISTIAPSGVSVTYSNEGQKLISDKTSTEKAVLQILENRKKALESL
jgi:hypothetical protein